ncbi:MAG: DDE-type integrase/transposase/recombinase, partial [Gammaproteobacteria bacterium]|nr:DDE-type integrase/transposase/recombinase [Gammaproteobacteria bacterium]
KLALQWARFGYRLAAFIEHLRSAIRNIALLFSQPGNQLYRSKRTARTDKHNHRYTQPKPEWLKREIILIKARMPQAGCRTIADLCNCRFAASRRITVGKTFVHETLQRHAYEVQILRRNLKQAKPKAVPRNLVWGLDLTGKIDTHGKLHALLGIIDHGSRALIHLQALHDKTTQTIINELRQTVRAHGKPKVIRTDNEGMFRSPAFGKALEQLGIRHQRTTPGCPWQNGRIERLFGTLKEKLDQWAVAGIEQLNHDLKIFRHWYNHIRPHQNLDGRTPAETWQGINPYVKPPIQEHWFEAWDGLLAGYHLRY